MHATMRHAPAVAAGQAVTRGRPLDGTLPLIRVPVTVTAPALVGFTIVSGLAGGVVTIDDGKTEAEIVIMAATASFPYCAMYLLASKPPIE